jgi:hypothetical protein
LHFGNRIPSASANTFVLITDDLEQLNGRADNLVSALMHAQVRHDLLLLVDSYVQYEQDLAVFLFATRGDTFRPQTEKEALLFIQPESCHDLRLKAF